MDSWILHNVMFGLAILRTMAALRSHIPTILLNLAKTVREELHVLMGMGCTHFGLAGQIQVGLFQA